MLRHRESRKSNAHTHARRFIHLTENQCRLIKHSALLHLEKEVVSLTASLSDTRKNGISAVFLCYVMYKLLDKNRFTDSRSSEKTYLSALRIGFKQVNDLDSGLKYLDDRSLLRERRCFSVYAAAFGIGRHVPLAVKRLTERIEHSAKRAFSDGNADSATCGNDFHASRNALAFCHHDTTDGIVPNMRLDLHYLPFSLDRQFQRLIDFRKLAFFKIYINDGA